MIFKRIDMVKPMAPRLRLVLVLAGLLLVVISLFALAYAFWPLPAVSDQATVMPTLLISP